ncbi:MAG TPA: hypothetical protein VNY05_32615 [Candidatus Acidoferrales bacterium]|jgi:hypothetical protein|nr:hypothetical protein [Candidatus Acidoferrales bacterium]
MDSIGLPELLVVLIFLGIVVIPGIFYLLTLQRALERCSPEARTTSPGNVWLMLIPLFNLVWEFILVIKIARSLHNEFLRRNIIDVEAEPGKSLGLAMCILSLTGFIPLLGIAGSLAGLVCWILYWVKISGYSQRLAMPVTWGTPLGAPPPPPPLR